MTTRPKITVSEESSSLRIDKFLSSQLSESRSYYDKLIKLNKVWINGKVVQKPSVQVFTDDVVEIEIPPANSTELVPWDFPLDIMFEDEHLIVINKPAGIVVHPSAGHPDKTLVNALLSHCDHLAVGVAEQRPGIVHRIDRDTSGLLVIAKTNESLRDLQQKFKDRQINRIYKCLVAGEVKNTYGKIESYLARHPKDRKKYSSVRDQMGRIIRQTDHAPDSGKYALTEYQLIKYYEKNVSLLSVKLGTGRTHQIRVHFSELGHRILGDPIYGNKGAEKTKLGQIEKNLGRIALHAETLGFTHPISKEELQFSAPWPDDLMPLTTFIDPGGCFEI